MTPGFSLCVYCGSRPGADPRFIEVAAQVGRWIGEHGGQLVYGGGNNGTMGALADAALKAGARVVGVIPQSMVQREWAKRDCTELHVVDNMHQRKSMMAQRADAFLALPGGLGTFEEFFEVWTWRVLDFHRKPVGLLDLDGYYQGLLQFLQQSVKSGFMNEWQMEMLTVGSDPQVLLPQLVQAANTRPADVSQI